MLHATIEHDWPSFFYEPETWRQISATNLTPWINLSFAMDWKLFGFDPHGFFIHHILSLALATLCCGLLLLEIVSVVPALGTLLLFVTSLPTLALAGNLWLRHYTEGLAFAALAFFFFLRGLKSSNFFYGLSGAFFYLISVTAKEIYVPLIGILLFYPGSFSKKGNLIKLPFLFVALAFVAWRSYMLGITNLFDPNVATSSNTLLSIGQFLALIFKAIFNYDLFAFCFFLAFAASLLLVVLKRDGYLLFFFLVCIASILIPVIPVAERLTNLNTIDLSPLRILTVVIFSLYLFVLHTFHNLNKKVAIFILTGTLIVNLWNLFGASALEKSIARHHNYQKMGEFLLKAGPGKVLVMADGAPWFFTELKKLASKTDEKPYDQSALFCTDGCLCQRLLKKQDVEFYYFNGSEVLKKMEWNCNVKEDAAPYAIFNYHKGMLAWEFGPFEQGQYCALPMQNGLPEGIYCLPRKGKIKVYLTKDAQVVLRYRDPSGWIAYSDVVEIKVDARKN